MELKTVSVKHALINKKGESQMKWLNVCIVLLILSGLSLISGTSHAATAEWTAVNDSTLQGYNLYRAPGQCANPGAFAKVQTYGLVTTGAIQNPATNGSYCHRLTSFNLAGESVFSNTAEFMYVVVPPTAPQGLIVKP